MKKLLVLAALALTLPLAGCGEDAAKSAVEAHGFTDVKLGGTPFYGCSESDDMFFSKTFTAIAVNGKPVSGVACGGAFKGWTVRLR